jgi:hypothetical protein
MGTTKKRRNRARGAAKAKKDAKAYIAPICRFESVKGGNGREEEGETQAHHSRRGNDNCAGYSMLAM